jgi:hypothetical protein
MISQDEYNNGIKSGLSNYYGMVTLVIKKGKSYLVLDDYSGIDQIEVSKQFAEAWLKEFNSESK